MSTLPTAPRILSSTADGLTADDNAWPGVEAEHREHRPRRESGRRWGAITIVLALSASLLFGWLVVGWWLWPVQWTNSAPWQLGPDYQRAYVTLVAREYGRTTNLAQVEEALAGWNRDDLAKLVSRLQSETTDAETGQGLAALAQALQLPRIDASVWNALAGQQGIILGVIAAAVPLLGALALASASAFARRRGQAPGDTPAEDEQAEQTLAELLADVNVGDEPDQVEPAQEEPKPGQAAEDKTQAKQEEPAKPEEDKKDKGEEAQSDLGDLASLFIEEDTTLAGLELFCKSLDEISVDNLLESAVQVSRQLRELGAARPLSTAG